MVRDVVCNMELGLRQAPAAAEHKGRLYYIRQGNRCECDLRCLAGTSDTPTFGGIQFETLPETFLFL